MTLFRSLLYFPETELCLYKLHSVSSHGLKYKQYQINNMKKWYVTLFDIKFKALHVP